MVEVKWSLTFRFDMLKFNATSGFKIHFLKKPKSLLQWWPNVFRHQVYVCGFSSRYFTFVSDSCKMVIDQTKKGHLMGNSLPSKGVS